MKRYRPFLAALLAYSVLALLLSWPLASHLTTHVPGIAQWAFDESTFLWNIWHVKHTLVDGLQSPLHSDLIWHPLGIDLILYTYNFFHALLAQPLMLAVDLPFASNIALLLSTVLSGFGTFLLVYYLFSDESSHSPLATRHSPLATRHPPLATRHSPLAAFLAGLLYAFASNRAIYAALGHYDMVTTQWIPFYALMLLRSLDETLSPTRRRKAALLAGIFFAFNGLAEMITALFLAIFTGIVVIVYLISLFRRRNFHKQEIERLGDWRVSNLPISQSLNRSTEDFGELSRVAHERLSISNLLITVLVAFLLWSPVLVPILRQFWVEDFSLKGWGEAIPLSSDLLGWFTPTILHPIFGHLVYGGDLVQELLNVKLRAQEIDISGFRDINTVFLGWVTLALAALGAWHYGRRVRIWLWSALLFGLFTLGPFLQINGRYRFDLDGESATFPLPYALLHYLPIIKANRAPNRNSVILMLALAVLVGYASVWLIGRLRDWEIRRFRLGNKGTLPISQSLTLLLACCLLFEHLALPAPLSDARIPQVYAQIAADPAPVSVMQIPLGWRNSFETFGAETTLLQYYQTVHGKAMIGGNISRAPDFKMDYFRNIPFFQVLTDIEFGRPVTPEQREAVRKQATDLLYLYNTGYVLLFPPIPNRFPYADHWQATWDFVKATLPLEAQPFWAQDGIEAYRVIQPAGDDHFLLDLGTAGTFPYRSEGWDVAEVDSKDERSAIWATGERSRLFIPLRKLDPSQLYQLTLQVRPFDYPGSPLQSVRLVVNGVEQSQQSLKNEWQSLTWTVAGGLLQNDLNKLDLHWGYNAVPRTVLAGNRLIGNTGQSLPIDVEINSFEDHAFIALFDETGQQIDGSAGRSGVNVTVLDPNSGEILHKEGFDTTANLFESAKLAQFLTTIEEGQPVLVASRGNASTFLTEDALIGLRRLGAELTVEGIQGQHFALVGVQGATSGSALLVTDPHQAFVRISLDRDRRALASSVDRVEIGRLEK